MMVHYPCPVQKLITHQINDKVKWNPFSESVQKRTGFVR